MTTRKPIPTALLGLFLPVLLWLSGCATPGPTRGYYLSSSSNDSIVQFNPVDPAAPPQSQDSYLGVLDIPIALAYDPYTDHFFIRLNPGDRFLVVDRPAQKIKRGFSLSTITLPAGAGDIAIRSSDRHLFIAHPSEPAVIETNLNGHFVRTIQLAGMTTNAAGLAYDQATNQLLTLDRDSPDKISIRTLDGQIESAVQLDHPTSGRGLAFDSAAREFFAPLPGPAGGLGVFSYTGSLKRTLPLPADPGLLGFDVGPHSFLRLF